MKKILKYIASAFLVLLVSLCIYTFVITDILKKDYVNVFGYTYFVVATGSMSGTIEVDDIIFVKITKDVKMNDVITFKNTDGDIITHRLVNMKEDKYITKDQIIGKVKLIVSPSFILKSIAIFLIVFILLALVNFDKIIKKYILKDNRTPVAVDENGNPIYSTDRLPETIFMNPRRRYEEPSSGLTVTIAIDEMEQLEKDHEQEESSHKEDDVEVLEDYDEYIFAYNSEEQSKDLEKNIGETIDFVVSILKCKKNNVAKARMNKRWLEKYQYVYRLCFLLLENNIEQLSEDIAKPPFKEIYDYDLDRVGLTESIRNRIYDMPIYVFLRILTYSILYNDDEMFDGVYKILKYKAMIDKDNQFKQIDANDKEATKQLKTLISFMQKVSNKFDNKNVFELEKIERLARIGKY